MQRDINKKKSCGGILLPGMVAAAFLHGAFAGTITWKANATGRWTDSGSREGGVLLRLSDTCGAVDSLIAADGSARVVPAAEAFTLQLLDGKGEPMRLKSSDFIFEGLSHVEHAERVEKSLHVLHGQTITWRHQNGLIVRMDVTATAGEFRFKPSVENIPAGMLLEWFDGPQIHVAADSTLFWPYVDGVEVTDVTRCGSPYRPVSFRDRNWHGIYSLYPNYCQMQFLAAYKNGKGVYFSAADDRHTPKSVNWERIGDETVRLSLLTFCGDLTDGAWRPSFHYVLRPYDGGWMDACEIYRDWVCTLPAFINPPKRPKWMYDSPVNLIYPVRGEGRDNLPRDMSPNCYFPYMNAMSAVEKYGELLDSRIMALLMHWEGTAPWAPPYVWPPYGGEEELARFRDALHARGDLLGVYCSGTAWTQVSCIVPSYSLEQRFEDERLGRHMVRGPKGEITAGCCNGPDAQRFGCEMCLADEWSVRTVVDEVAKMSRFGIDYCQFFDQNNGGGWHLCYAKNHGHPPIPGAWEVDAMISLQKKVVASAAYDGMLLGCEASAATPYVPQLFYNDVRFAWAFWKSGIGGARPVHGSAFVFHEWACNFSGNQCASHDIDPFYRWSYAFHNGDMLSLVLGRDNGLVVGWGRSWDDEFTEQKELASLVRRFNALRKKHLSFLLEGRMLKPPFKCESRQAKLCVRAKTHEYSPEVPEVFVSFWENAEGKRIGFGNWWKRFGKEHPEYFNLLSTGDRKPLYNNAQGVTMCVSEPGVWKQKVEDWRKNLTRIRKSAKGPNARYEWINCCENDYAGLCMCEKCRSWDAPDPRFALNDYWSGKADEAYLAALFKVEGFYGLDRVCGDERWVLPKIDPNTRNAASLSDRYAKFYNAVVAEARKFEPGARVIGYAYDNYVEAPKQTHVDGDVVIEFVPRSYFPYDKTESNFFRKHWIGWRKAGVRDFVLRPNYMLAGGNYPIDNGRMILDDFAFAYTNGMIACGFDSLRGSWSCHLLMDYALTRAFRNPLRGYEKAREDVLSAFGTAAKAVARYFDRVESFTASWTEEKVREASLKNIVGGRTPGGSFPCTPAILGEFYDDRFFPEMYRLLDGAVDAAGGDAIVVARIEYLRKGLRDAELTRDCRIAQKKYEVEKSEGAKQAWHGAFRALAAYRKSVEGDFICAFDKEAKDEARMGWPHDKLGKEYEVW